MLAEERAEREYLAWLQEAEEARQLTDAEEASAYYGAHYAALAANGGEVWA